MNLAIKAARMITDFAYRMNSIYLRNEKAAKFLGPVRATWRKLGFGRSLRDYVSSNDPEHQSKLKEFRQSDAAHETELGQLREMLADERSRYTLDKLLAFRRTSDRSLLKDIVIQPQYFQKDIFSPVEDEVFVDGGAYSGDTIESFIQSFAGGGYKRIYTWEPDKANFTTLKNRTKRFDNIVYIPCGLWSEKKQLHFLANGDFESKITEDAGQNTMVVDVDSIDNVCAGDKVTLIKMDIEGSEMEALKGAENVIRRDKPRLAICVYHKPEDLYEIPLWIKRTVPEYKLYLRHHYSDYNETVIYATL